MQFSRPVHVLCRMDQSVWLLLFQLFLLVPLAHGRHDEDVSDKVIFTQGAAEERIVQDIISLQSGVPLDFSYNETTTGSSIHVSAPGCPKRYDGRPWLYFGSPPKCYLVGFQGPCSWGKRFFQEKNSKYGICNCDCFAQSSEPSSIVDIDIGQNLILPRRGSRVPSVLTLITGNRKIFSQRSIFPILSKHTKNSEGPELTDLNRYNFCSSASLKRQVVYDSLRQECYPFLEQGPCLSGEWLIRDLEKENGVACEKRKCPEFLGYNQPASGGGFTYFDYKAQTCLTEVYGSLQESFFVNTYGIISNRQIFCRDAGMKYSSKLKTCVKDTSSMFDFKILG